MKPAERKKRERLYKEAMRLMDSGRRRKVPQPWPDGDMTRAPFADCKLTETQSLRLLRDKVMEGIAAGMPMGGDPGGFVMAIDEELSERRKRARQPKP